LSAAAAAPAARELDTGLPKLDLSWIKRQEQESTHTHTIESTDTHTYHREHRHTHIP